MISQFECSFDLSVDFVGSSLSSRSKISLIVARSVDRVRPTLCLGFLLFTVLRLFIDEKRMSIPLLVKYSFTSLTNGFLLWSKRIASFLPFPHRTNRQ